MNELGINRNVACSIVFGTNSLGGFEMHHLYTLQGMKRLQYFLGHIACKEINGYLMMICMEHIQLDVGTYEPFLFLQHSYAGNALINQSWITTIWAHLELCKGMITKTNSWRPKPQRVYDMELMSMAFEANLSTARQCQINPCRIFHRVIYPSDITSFDDKRITQSTYDGMSDPIES
jgi:hypothetical protein